MKFSEVLKKIFTQHIVLKALAAVLAVACAIISSIASVI